MTVKTLTVKVVNVKMVFVRTTVTVNMTMLTMVVFHGSMVVFLTAAAPVGCRDCNLAETPDTERVHRLRLVFLLPILLVLLQHVVMSVWLVF